MSLRLKIAAAFLAVYVIWGSTYLAIAIVEESLPPFFMAGTRFVLAGVVLYVWAKLRHAGREFRVHWRSAFVIGGLMLLGGHGAVVWAEQWVPSGLTSLLIATVPLWMVFVDWLRGGSKPSLRVAGGLTLGFLGVALLVGSLEDLGGNSIGLIGGMVVVVGAFLWANGSLYSRSAKLPKEPLLSTGMEMVAGGVLLLAASLATGEYDRIRLDLVSERSLVAWVYLVVFGAIVAFTCYVWLLKTVSATRVSTYAYVNPIVAMLLGWALANEPITTRNTLAAGIILVSVIIITIYQARDKATEGPR
jgi:drug/metabolite transporter (DMT)-like permease